VYVRLDPRRLRLTVMGQQTEDNVVLLNNRTRKG